MEKTLPLSEAKMRLHKLVEEVQQKDDEFIITKNGEPAAVLIPTFLYESWKETSEILSDQELVKEIKRGIQNLKKRKKRHSFEEIFGEVP